MPQLACFCHAAIAAPADGEFFLVECPQCGASWAAWVVDGRLASQVHLEPGMPFEDLWFKLRLYGVRAHVSEWESNELRALFVATYTARLRWERFDRWGRRVVWFFGLPGLRWLNRAPFWIVARIFGRWGKPAHLRRYVAEATPADVARVQAITWGRA